MRITTGGWQLDVFIHGYPGRSTVHGGLGWSTVALLRGHGRVVVLDGGGYGMRRPVVEGLARLGVAPAEVTDLLLSHAHYDHAVNWPLFRNAHIAIGRVELDWARGVPPGETPVAEHAVAALARLPGLRLLEDGEEVHPGITAHLAPGHTPGHLVFLVGGERPVLLLQDAAKNRTELVGGDTDMTYDPAVSRATIAMLREMAARHPGCVLVPGHDVPLAFEDGALRPLARHGAAIRAWFGEDLSAVTTFGLAPPGR
jgi:glyoxylase-like metal-dependent hydrolase (beta-lactamase superfamily II)